jgi:predicted AAA+ superfamily ATPase
VVCLVEWAAWVVWVEWECNQSRPLKVFKNAREINLSGVFFYSYIQCLFNVYSMSVASLFSLNFKEDKIYKKQNYIINKHTINRFKVVADKDMRKMSNIVENLIRRYVESRV